MISDNELRDRLNRLGRAVAPGESIADKVMNRIGTMPTQTAHPVGARRIFMLVKSRPAIAAAAVIVIALMIPFLHFPGSDIQDTSIAWGDVVEATNQVEQIHITAFIQENDEDIKLDLYYRRPGTWRAHGKNVIQFVENGKSRFFDIKEKKFTKTYFRLLPPSVVKATITEKGILDGVLRFFFMDKVPPGTPVKASGQVLGADMEVFDYANDPKERWMRIWVLRESRLPLRIKAYTPEQNDSVLVLFDYSDPQAAGFFDPDKFLKQVKETRPRKPREFYAIGRELAQGRKPRSPREIYKVQGGYKSPKLVEIVANNAGDLLIVAIDPRNKSPRGGSLEGTYHEELRDNWGNLYRRFYRHLGIENRHRSETYYMYYTPIGPVRQGEGKHTITLRYAVRDHAHHLGYNRVVSEEIVAIPDPTAGESLPQWRKDYDFASYKQNALDEYLRWNGDTLLKQLDYVESQLHARGESGKLTRWKISLLKKLGEEEQACEFFEATAKDKAIAEPFRHNFYDSMLSDYMQRLWRAGRQKEVLAIIEKIRAARAAMLAGAAGAPHHVIRHVKSRIEQSPLSLWLEAPQALKDLDAGRKPTPKVEQIARSEDGWVYMIIRIPDVKRKEQYGYGQPVWDHPRIESEDTWKKNSSLKIKDQIFLKSRGHGETLGLVFEPVVADKLNGGELRLPWRLEVKVPPATAKTADELKRQFPKEWFSKPDDSTTKPFSAYYQTKTTAYKLRSEGKYAQALQLYRKTLSMPIPEKHEEEKLNQFLIQRDRFWGRLDVARCLIGLERYDEAWKYLDEVKKDVEGKKVFPALDPARWLDPIFMGIRASIAA
ncbi:MAG: hypothetical protein SVV80_12365, partial [Planctomycetota bacterium]|nr:hypothetical protein [Planctomycetota bacterium]